MIEQEVSMLKTQILGRRQIFAYLSLVLIIVLICSSPEVQINWMRSDTQPDQANANESRHEFMLPITLPESQVSHGILIARAKLVLIQSRNKFIFTISGSMLLLGCIVLCRYRACRIVQYIHHLKPEMSLRIGGHAPPAAIFQ